MSACTCTHTALLYILLQHYCTYSYCTCTLLYMYSVHYCTCTVVYTTVHVLIQRYCTPMHCATLLFVARCVGIIKGAACSIISILRMVGSYSTPLEVREMTFV